MADYIIDDVTPDPDLSPPPGADSGLIDRDFAVYPPGYLVCAKPFDIPLMSDGEIEAALRRQESDGSVLEKLAREIPVLDQDGYGYCWAHSSAMAVQLVRGMNNQPYEPLSAFAVAAIIKGYRNEGGWCAQSLEFIAEHGIPSQKFWPQGAVKRSLDTPEMRENAKLHRVQEWMDLDPSRSMARQLATCLLNGIPVATDFNWWGHSVCSFKLVSWNPFKTLIKNSWSGWGENGVGSLEGRRAVPDGAIAPRVITS